MNGVLIRQNQMEFMKKEGFALQQITYDNKRQRGAIVIHAANANKKIGICPCGYMELDIIIKSFPKHVIQMVQEYNPNEEFIVVFFVDKNQRIDAYRLKLNIRKSEING